MLRLHLSEPARLSRVRRQRLLVLVKVASIQRTIGERITLIDLCNLALLGGRSGRWSNLYPLLIVIAVRDVASNAIALFSRSHLLGLCATSHSTVWEI